jgi:hypothetical protein
MRRLILFSLLGSSRKPTIGSNSPRALANKGSLKSDAPVVPWWESSKPDKTAPRHHRLLGEEQRAWAHRRSRHDRVPVNEEPATLDPGKSVTLTAQFTNPTNVLIAFSAKAYCERVSRLPAQLGLAKVQNFAGGGGTLNLADLLVQGVMTGDLPGAVTLYNFVQAVNEYSPAFTYGAFVSFDVSLLGRPPESAATLYFAMYDGSFNKLLSSAPDPLTQALGGHQPGRLYRVCRVPADRYG